MNLRYLILGLLTQQPMSGYDVKRFLASFGWLIGSPSFGSLYPALNALLKEGLVSVEVIPRTDKPSRKLYSITDAGEAALHTWLKEPAAPPTSMRTFVMHLLLTDQLSTAALRRHLEARWAEVLAHREGLEVMELDELEGEGRGQSMARSYGLALASAELAWLEATLASLDDARTTAPDVEGAFRSSSHET